MSTVSKTLRSLLISGLLFTVTGAHAQNQETGETGPPDAELLNFKNWAVRCVSNETSGEKKACVMFQRLNLDSGQHLLTMQVLKQQVNSEDNKIVDTAVFAVPWGVHLKRGLGINVDDGEVYRVEYERCDPNGCYAGMILVDDMLQSMMKGNEARISFVEPSGKALSVPVSLSGFTAAYRSLP